MSGIFYGVGVGPGDPELLTVKAVNVIKEADIIIAPRTEKIEKSTALKIASPYLKDSVEVVHLVFPMVFHEDVLTDAWEENKRIILDFLTQGKKVVFLTLGDPMLFSTYIYVFKLLKDSGYPIKTIPGIPAFCAIASHVGMPLAEGNQVLSIVPTTKDEKALEDVINKSDNLVLMKVYKNYVQVVEKLKESGHIANSVMVSRCGLDNEEIFTNLENVKKQQVNYLSTVLAKRSGEK